MKYPYVEIMHIPDLELEEVHDFFINIVEGEIVLNDTDLTDEEMQNRKAGIAKLHALVHNELERRGKYTFDGDDPLPGWFAPPSSN